LNLTNTINKTTTLPIMEAFYTLQGEGFHHGKAAYFIRLAGCDVGCVWCDVKESWNEDSYPLQTIDNIVSKAIENPARLAVITGGEPTLYNLETLTLALKNEGFQTNIETSGSSPLTGTWEWICLSPKKFKPPLQPILKKANELKIIIFNKSDFQWAEKYAAEVSINCKLYLQPEWSKSEQVTPLIVEYIKAHPQWQFSLQMHKYIHVP
jgi:7-carboxy-7-deazaguanine synthase